jgi:outer membrane protein assembly factor BamB
VFADAGRVVVQGDIGGWAFDAADGTRHVGSTDYLVVTRTGHLAASGAGLVVLDDAGAELFPLAGQPIYLGVDDGSAPDTELLITSRPGEGRLLTAVQVPSGDELWSVARPRWTDGAAVLLDDVLYAADGDGVSALDARTGSELWRTPVATSTEVGGGVMTDGRHLLVVARADRLTEAGFTVGAPEDDSARWVGGEAAVPPDGGLGLSLAAFDLGSGRPAWATRLPPEVRQVWGHRGDLVGWGDDVTVVLN